MKFDEDGRPVMRLGITKLELSPTIHLIDAVVISTYIKEHPGCGEVAIAKCMMLGVQFKHEVRPDGEWFVVIGPWHHGSDRATKERAAVEVCLMYDIPMEVTIDA